jgi:hypothetical protein
MGSACIDPRIFNNGNSWRWVLSGYQSRSGRRREEEILSLQGLELRPLGRPTCSHSLYRLRYPSLLSNGYRGRLPRSGKHGSIYLHPHKFSWRSAWLIKHSDNFTWWLKFRITNHWHVIPSNQPRLEFHYLESSVFWDWHHIIRWKWIDGSEKNHFRLQSGWLSQARNQYEVGPIHCLLQAICSSQTLVDFYCTARRHILEDTTRHTHHCENLKSALHLVAFLYIWNWR